LHPRAAAAADRYQQAARTHPLLGLPPEFLSRYAARNGVLLASAAAFRLFLWLLPLALLVAGVLAGAIGTNAATARSAVKTAGVTGTASKEAVTAISSGHRSWGEAVLLGSFLFLWATWTLIRNLTAMNAHAWQVRVPAHHLGAAVRTTFTFAGAFLVLAAGASALSHLHGTFPGDRILGVVVEAAAASAVWLTVSLRLPDGRTRWTDLVPGSLLVGISLSALNAVAQFYIPLRLKHASQLYGTLGVAGVILAWLLIIGQVLVSAALINSVWADYRHGPAAERTS